MKKEGFVKLLGRVGKRPSRLNVGCAGKDSVLEEHSALLECFHITWQTWDMHSLQTLRFLFGIYWKTLSTRDLHG